jgi:hypothetical protein
MVGRDPMTHEDGENVWDGDGGAIAHPIAR